jgi:DNA repair protein RadD
VSQSGLSAEDPVVTSGRTTNILRSYQQDAVVQLEDALAAGKNPLWIAPTGAGKTLVAAALIERAVERGQRVLAISHRREIIRQTSFKMPIEHGIIQAGIEVDYDYPVQIASIQTLHARAIRSAEMSLPAANLIIVDECHRVASASYRALLDAYPNARRIGFTATPCRGDGRGLGNHFDELILGPQVAELVAQGHLVPAVYFAPCEIDLKGVKTQAGDYQIKQLAERVDRPDLVGGIVENWFRHAQRRKTIVFCVDVGHGAHVAEEFVRAGVRAENIHGGTPTSERDAILARFATGKTELVTNAMILVEGFDCPDVGCVILARPTKQMGLYRQAAGRGLRPASGKSDLRIIDHAGACLRHGLLEDPIAWTLSPDKRAENPTHEARTTSQFTRLIECRECKALRTGGQPCPHCGWFPQRRPEAILFADGDLVEVRKGKATTPSYSQADRNTWHAMLTYIAQERGYKPDWVSFKYKDKFGVWPRWGASPQPVEPSPEVLSWIRSRQIAYAKGRQKARAA